MKYSAQLLISTICLVLTLNYNVVQAKLPWFGRGGAQAAVLTSSSTSIDYDIQEYEIEITTPTNTRRRQASTTTTKTKTEAAELARLFDQALVAVNRQKQDIHVGKLLSACEQLAQAIRNIGFGQSANDILNNVKKVKDVYNKFPSNKNGSNRDSITAILQYEIDSGIHGSTTRGLSENSATMGFLWLARIINYQYDMFSHMINHNHVEPYEAAVYAYERTLKPHLSSWTVRKIVQAALMTLKTMKKETIFSRIGGFNDITLFGQQEELATIRDVQQFLDISQVILKTCRQAFSDLNIDHV